MNENENIKYENIGLYGQFYKISFTELETLLLGAQSREEKAFYRALLNLKLQIAQEKIIGEILL